MARQTDSLSGRLRLKIVRRDKGSGRTTTTMARQVLRRGWVCSCSYSQSTQPPAQMRHSTDDDHLRSPEWGNSLRGCNFFCWTLRTRLLMDIPYTIIYIYNGHTYKSKQIPQAKLCTFTSFRSIRRLTQSAPNRVCPKQITRTSLAFYWLTQRFPSFHMQAKLTCKEKEKER